MLLSSQELEREVKVVTRSSGIVCSTRGIKHGMRETRWERVGWEKDPETFPETRGDEIPKSQYEKKAEEMVSGRVSRGAAGETMATSADRLGILSSFLLHSEIYSSMDIVSISLDKT